MPFLVMTSRNVCLVFYVISFGPCVSTYGGTSNSRNSKCCESLGFFHIDPNFKKYSTRHEGFKQFLNKIFLRAARASKGKSKSFSALRFGESLAKKDKDLFVRFLAESLTS